MNKIYHKKFAECYLLEYIHQSGLLDLNSSQINFVYFCFIQLRKKILNLQNAKQ